MKTQEITLDNTRLKINIDDKLFEIVLNKLSDGFVINKVDFAESSQITITVNVSNEIEIK